MRDPVRLTAKVIVLGDSVVALDAARTALRLGATDVTVMTRHQADDLPAGNRELTAALEEGVKFEFGARETKASALAGSGATVFFAGMHSEGKRMDAHPLTGRTAS